LRTDSEPARNVDGYIAGFPKGTQTLLRQIRAVIVKAAPDADEGLSYRMPAYKFHGALVYFAGYERHIGFYPGAAGIASFKKELSLYKSAKGSVQFPLDEPLPLRLIAEIVAFRVRQNLAKAKGNPKSKAGPKTKAEPKVKKPR
jgi:uncharacterized protein YdhG (YjbR/CyaY superfamily)